MAKMKRDELEKIVRRQMPGYRLARKAKAPAGTDAGRAQPVSSAGTPDLAALRRKYLANDSVASARPAARAASDRAPDRPGDDEIVAVEPEEAPHPWDRAARPKAVVVSGRHKRIVGKQG